ncbi:MAG: Stp1/IreP family PP2C-type Ser/Thr phosphatase [Bacilli bacterium]|nr:Stp1/IreP family PP2C-type Ser/Thr phosphatase [Bacilli bacterium]
MPKRYKGRFAHKVDIGKIRITNEDQANVMANGHGEVLLCVCDGMGGQNKGDYASKIAITTMFEEFQLKRKTSTMRFAKSWLIKTIKKANSLIFREASTNPEYKDMGTTCVAVLIIDNRMIVANVGDSRAYAYMHGNLTHLTEDQTYVDYLYRTGKIEASEMATRSDRHVLMNALGIYPSASLDCKVLPYFGQSVLLCSDGLYNNLAEGEIRACLSTDERPDQKVNALVAEANANGGSDNIGVAYWECVRDD